MNWYRGAGLGNKSGKGGGSSYMDRMNDQMTGLDRFVGDAFKPKNGQVHYEDRMKSMMPGQNDKAQREYAGDMYASLVTEKTTALDKIRRDQEYLLSEKSRMEGEMAMWQSQLGVNEQAAGLLQQAQQRYGGVLSDIQKNQEQRDFTTRTFNRKIAEWESKQ